MSRFDSFDFAFPIGSYGNSSGWWPSRGVDLHRQPDLAARRLVRLTPCGSSLLVDAGDYFKADRAIKRVPFFRKSPLNETAHLSNDVALSSGAGSAIFRCSNGNTFKLKRCGVGDSGFQDQTVRGHRSEFREGEQYEFSAMSAPSGLMTVKSALRELDMAAEFCKKGLSIACVPRSIVLLSTLEQQNGAEKEPLQPCAAVLMQIQSDFRADELVYMTLSPLIADLFATGLLSYDPDYRQWAFYDAFGIPISRTRRKWADITERLSCIGKSVGSSYRRCHESGFLRGIGSCWFGNEVISGDGEVSLVDFDGGTIADRGYDLSASLKDLEISHYVSESFLLLSTMRPQILQLFANDFIEGVRQGYCQPYRPIAQQLLEVVINDHFANAGEVWRGLGFASDPCTPLQVVAPVGAVHAVCEQLFG